MTCNCSDKNKLILEKIEKLCKETREEFGKTSGDNPYSAGRCITAEQVLMLINGRGKMNDKCTECEDDTMLKYSALGIETANDKLD